MLGSLDHDLLANIAKRVRDRARRYVATEHVTHVFPGRSISCYVSKVPETSSVYLTNQMSDGKLARFMYIFLSFKLLSYYDLHISHLSLIRIRPERKGDT